MTILSNNHQYNIDDYISDKYTPSRIVRHIKDLIINHVIQLTVPPLRNSFFQVIPDDIVTVLRVITVIYYLSPSVFV